jgi:soluble lytic murein transglycosylase-like protein
MHSVLLRAKFALLAALLLGMAMPALAADAPVMGWHIALRSGFDLTCARMSALGSHGEKTRLFLHPSGDDFVDINSADIVATEQVELPPDPVQDVPSSGSVSTAAANAGSPLDIAALTADAGKRVNLDADLIASIIHAESAGNPHAISRTGARGLMQLMPATASQVGVQDAFNPAQNVTGGTTKRSATVLRSASYVSPWPPTTPGPAPLRSTTAFRRIVRHRPMSGA